MPLHQFHACREACLAQQSVFSLIIKRAHTYAVSAVHRPQLAFQDDREFLEGTVQMTILHA